MSLIPWLLFGIGILTLLAVVLRSRRHTPPSVDDLPTAEQKEMARLERLRIQAAQSGDANAEHYYDGLQLGIIGLYLNLDFLDAKAALESWRDEL